MPKSPQRVHFIGVGGAGMSGIARLFVAAGISVTGSDIRDTHIVADLRDAGVRVRIGHDQANIGAADTVVVSGAIAEDNPEYRYARDSGIPVVHRAVALAWLTKGRRLVAVAGAHGKTTSTAMIVCALRALGTDPGFVNGGVISSLGVSASPGSEDLFIVEADESDGSFLLYSTSIALITNVDPDHLDHFGSEAAFKEAFVQFSSAASDAVVISADDAGAIEITPSIGGAAVSTFGTEAHATLRIHSLESGPTASFWVRVAGEEVLVHLKVAGHHNALNAAGALGVLIALGFDPHAAADALGAFEGTERRFEFRGEVGGVRVFDDFAHHPTEIEAALSGARAVAGHGRIIPIFQPHLYSRTQRMAAEFATVLEQGADFSIVVPVYAAREVPEPGVTGKLITDRFVDARKALLVDSWADAIEAAVRAARPGDILVSMGGGDVFGLVPDLLAALERHHDTAGDEAVDVNRSASNSGQ